MEVILNGLHETIHYVIFVWEARGNQITHNITHAKKLSMQRKNKFYSMLAQRARTDLNKRFLPKPMTTTG